KHKILAALVYLRGTCPERVLDMTLPGVGCGTLHAPLVWEVADDAAGEALAALEAGATTWGAPFWAPLVKGGDDSAVLTRWREIASRVEDARARNDLARIALVFAELAGRLAAWSDALRGWDMIESQLVWELTADARRESEVTTRREVLL